MVISVRWPPLLLLYEDLRRSKATLMPWAWHFASAAPGGFVGALLLLSAVSALLG
ncbi:hypothetical protein ACIOHO_10000 [Streptomyces sp. NPDC087849]|uniref:hypothetical protein n=1 Tax=Streptomyces sp. NPDC087849 TaxID=3365808 RepID=UPI0038051498